MDTINFIAVFIIGVVAAFVGASVGGGGLLSIPLLIFLGIPPQITIATNKFAGIGLSMGALVKYNRSKKVNWNYVLPLSIVAAIGGYLGSQILVNINEEFLSSMVGFLLLLPLPFLFKKEVGVLDQDRGKVLKTLGFIIYFIGATFGGFFGGGAGLFMFYTLVLFFGFTVIEANATHLFPWLFLSMVASVVFILNGLINFKVGTILLLGMMLGGYLGAKFAIKKGDKWIKVGFAAVIATSSIKLIFF